MDESVPPPGLGRSLHMSAFPAAAASWKKAQEAIIAANSAEEERAAELQRDPADDLGDDPLARMEGTAHGTDADAGEYLQTGDEGEAGEQGEQGEQAE